MAKRSSSSGKSNHMSPKMPERKSVEVRKISNGYIVNTSVSKGDKYMSKEEYSKTKPNIKI